ncbi:MAG: peptidylprolyl isomerase, partial [Gammaproteobacteria bacterium]
MNIKRLTGIAAITLAAALAGCNSQNGKTAMTETTTDNGNAVATVNGQPISKAVFDEYVSQRMRGHEPNQQQREALLDQLISMEVLAQAAHKEGIADQPDVAAELQISRQSVLARAAFQHHMESANVSDEDVKTAYDKQYGGEPKTEFKARHILVKDKDTAENLIKQLNKGADFGKLAKENSIGPSKKQGGDLGWFSPDQMVEPFSAAVEKLKKGEYTKAPVQTRYGWHVIQLEDTRTVPQPKLDEVKGH